MVRSLSPGPQWEAIRTDSRNSTTSNESGNNISEGEHPSQIRRPLPARAGKKRKEDATHPGRPPKRQKQGGDVQLSATGASLRVNSTTFSTQPTTGVNPDASAINTRESEAGPSHVPSTSLGGRGSNSSHAYGSEVQNSSSSKYPISNSGKGKVKPKGHQSRNVTAPRPSLPTLPSQPIRNTDGSESASSPNLKKKMAPASVSNVANISSSDEGSAPPQRQIAVKRLEKNQVVKPPASTKVKPPNPAEVIEIFSTDEEDVPVISKQRVVKASGSQQPKTQQKSRQPMVSSGSNSRSQSEAGSWNQLANVISAVGQSTSQKKSRPSNPTQSSAPTMPSSKATVPPESATRPPSNLVSTKSPQFKDFQGDASSQIASPSSPRRHTKISSADQASLYKFTQSKLTKSSWPTARKSTGSIDALHPTEQDVAPPIAGPSRSSVSSRPGSSKLKYTPTSPSSHIDMRPLRDALGVEIPPLESLLSKPPRKVVQPAKVKLQPQSPQMPRESSDEGIHTGTAFTPSKRSSMQSGHKTLAAAIEEAGKLNASGSSRKASKTKDTYTKHRNGNSKDVPIDLTLDSDDEQPAAQPAHGRAKPADKPASTSSGKLLKALLRDAALVQGHKDTSIASTSASKHIDPLSVGESASLQSTPFARLRSPFSQPNPSTMGESASQAAEGSVSVQSAPFARLRSPFSQSKPSSSSKSSVSTILNEVAPTELTTQAPLAVLQPSPIVPTSSVAKLLAHQVSGTNNAGFQSRGSASAQSMPALILRPHPSPSDLQVKGDTKGQSEDVPRVMETRSPPAVVSASSSAPPPSPSPPVGSSESKSVSPRASSSASVPGSNVDLPLSAPSSEVTANLPLSFIDFLAQPELSRPAGPNSTKVARTTTSSSVPPLSQAEIRPQKLGLINVASTGKSPQVPSLSLSGNPYKVAIENPVSASAKSAAGPNSELDSDTEAAMEVDAILAPSRTLSSEVEEMTNALEDQVLKTPVLPEDPVGSRSSTRLQDRSRRSSKSSLGDHHISDFDDDDEFAKSASSPHTSPSPSPSEGRDVVGTGKTLGGFAVVTWREWRKSFVPKVYFANDLPHELQDHVNVDLSPSEQTRSHLMMRHWFQAAIEQNTVEDEPDAPPIEIINHIDDEPTPPWEFHYSNRMWHADGVPPPDVKGLVGCNCVGRCDPKSKTCSCLKRQRSYHEEPNGDFVYDKSGRLKMAGYPIFECNDLCNCDDDCRNRVVQHGRKVQISIAKTATKGWGVFAGSKKVLKGAFLGIYAGELLTEEEGHERGLKYNIFGRTYLFDLDFYFLKSGNPDWEVKYVVDAYHAGNFTRFLNHSCDPNCRLYACYVNEGNIEKPLLAVFARRDIEPYEEICFNYHGSYQEDGDDEEPGVDDEADSDEKKDEIYKRCQCGAARCTGKMFK